jgi:hypothetical protein
MRYFISLASFARRLFLGIVLIILFITIALHFGLVDVGQWANDDFSIVNSYRDDNWATFGDRLMHWSPRPLSELLIWAYACLVNWTHKPLIGVFLGSLWLPLILAPVISFMQIRHNFSGERRKSLAFLSIFAFGLIALFLLEHSPGELFYWPVGAAAYLTTLSAISLCFFQLSFDLTENRRGRVITGMALVIAAGSSETGAFFVIAFGSLYLLDTFWIGIYPRQRLWCLLPMVIAIGVFGLLLHSRSGNQEAIVGTVEYHNLWLSLKAAFGQTLKEYCVSAKHAHPRGILLGLLLKVCFFVAVRCCWLCSGLKAPRADMLFVFGASVIATTFFSVTATYYGYGGLVNSWHEELRQCLVMLLIASAGLLSCHYHARVKNLQRWEWLGAGFMFITLMLVVPARVNPLIHDYSNYSICIVNREKSWASGLSAGNTMTWYSPPMGRVASTFIFPPGVYSTASKGPDYAIYMLRFFHKERLEIRSRL